MAFEGLSTRLQAITRKLGGKARITENDLKEVMREVKLALLEADVNYKIVKDFIAEVEKKALGQDVLKSLTPGQQVVKIVRDEMTELLGGVTSKINFTPNPPTIIMLVGLQGSGKTTTSGKLANLLRKQGKKPLLVACDVYRPAAIKQLQVVGKSLNIPVYANENSKDVVRIAKQAISEAYSKLNDVIILDTAGRLHIDEDLMQELKNVKTNVKPHEILLVVDSMTGQDAVNVAQTFNEKLGIDGVILTKHNSCGLTPTVVKASTGAAYTVPVSIVTNLSQTLRNLKQEGYWVVGTDMKDAREYREGMYDSPTVLVIGSEGQGISNLVKKQCDYMVYLPMVGSITSLNASVAAAVLMYEVYNQRNPIK